MLKKGDIVLLPYPFTDLSGQKARPALIISSDKFNNNRDAIFVFITKEEYKTHFDIRINSTDIHFANTGLKASSTIRVSKLVTLEKTLVKRKLGYADAAIMSDVELRLRALLDI